MITSSFFSYHSSKVITKGIFPGLYTGTAGIRGTAWDRLARRRRIFFFIPLSREWDSEVTFHNSRWDGYKQVICVLHAMGMGRELLNTRDGNGSRWGLFGMEISNNVAWEWEMMGSTWNGNGSQ